MDTWPSDKVHGSPTTLEHSCTGTVGVRQLSSWLHGTPAQSRGSLAIVFADSTAFRRYSCQIHGCLAKSPRRSGGVHSGKGQSGFSFEQFNDIIKQSGISVL
ncbi:hypothetical protein AMTRI_Chr06g169270 [Amborella trichopoda]